MIRSFPPRTEEALITLDKNLEHFRSRVDEAEKVESGMQSTSALRAVNPPDKIRAYQALRNRRADLAENRIQERVELKDEAGVAQEIVFAWPLTSGNSV